MFNLLKSLKLPLIKPIASKSFLEALEAAKDIEALTKEISEMEGLNTEHVKQKTDSKKKKAVKK